MTDRPLRREASDDGRSWAVFSFTRSHRYALGRDWSGKFDTEERTLVAAGLHPSEDGIENHQTSTTETGFGSRLGCVRLVKFNLFGHIETKSALLANAPRPIGGANDEVIRRELAKLDPTRLIVLAAWGSHPMATTQRIDEVLALLPRPVFCLGTTADGQPRHTSRLAYVTPVSIWKA